MPVAGPDRSDGEWRPETEWHPETVRETGIILARVAAVAALIFAVMTGPALRGEPVGPAHAAALVLLGATALCALAIQPSGGRAWLPEPWNVVGVVGLTLFGAALVLVVPDGTSAAVPVLAAAFAPRAGVARWIEYGLVAVDVAALWVFCAVSGSPWWTYPAALAAVFATYQAGLRNRDRLQRAEAAEVLLAREQALAAERERAAATAERERIARDLHDVLAHTLAGLAITVQGASLLLEAGRLEEVGGHLARARALAVEGMAEARSALAALDPAGGARPVDLRAAVERAVGEHRVMSGAAVDLTVGPLPDLPAEVTSAVLAVLRESLTNVLRHAPGCAVRVDLGCQDGLLRLAVVNDLPGAGSDRRADPRIAAPRTADGGGRGVPGMTARAEELGGELTAGPDAGRWKVTLSIQVPAVSRPERRTMAA